MILNDVNIFYLKADPSRPVKLGENQKTGEERKGWEVELRTTDKDVAKQWRVDFNGGKNVRAVREDKDDEESPIKFWRWKLRKNAFKANGESSPPVEVLRGDTGEPLDPRIVGNDSLADVRIIQREYTIDGVTNTASYLLAVSVKRLVKYEAPEREEFETVDKMEVIDDQGAEVEAGKAALEAAENPGKSKGKGGNRKKAVKTDDLEDEIPF